MVQATISLTLHFKHQHLGTFQYLMTMYYVGCYTTAHLIK